MKKKKICLLTLCLLLTGCIKHENQEAIDYLKSEESITYFQDDFIPEDYMKPFIWVETEENVFVKEMDRKNQYNELIIDFNQKIIFAKGYYKDDSDDVSLASYDWINHIGTKEKPNENCLIVVNMENKTFRSEECDCISRYETIEAYKNKEATAYWDSIYQGTIEPLLNTPADPYKLK